MEIIIHNKHHYEEIKKALRRLRDKGIIERARIDRCGSMVMFETRPAVSEILRNYSEMGKLVIIEHYKLILEQLSSIYDGVTAIDVCDWCVENGCTGRVSALLEDIKKCTEMSKPALHNHLLAALKGCGIPPELLPEPTKKSRKTPAKGKKSLSLCHEN
jgi:DNA-binding transcriptional ArsR family regulator